MRRLESTECQIKLFIPGSTARICTQHFTKDQIDRFGLTIRLRKGAIPTIFKRSNTSEPQVMNNIYIYKCN